MNVPAVEFSDLCKVYTQCSADGTGVRYAVRRLFSRRERFSAVDGVSGIIPKGTVTSVIGGNGAGKSTLLGMIACVKRPTSGELRVMGMDPTKDSRAIRSRTGYLPQYLSLYEKLTVRENLDYFASSYRTSGSADEAMDRFGLRVHADKLYQDLSGGLKQRLCIACISLGDPDLVLMDEPDSGMDPDIRQGLWDLIAEMKENGTTVVLTTHHTSEAKLHSDIIIRMSSGRITYMGPPEGVRSTVTVSVHDPDGSLTNGLEPFGAENDGTVTRASMETSDVGRFLEAVAACGGDPSDAVIATDDLPEGGI